MSDSVNAKELKDTKSSLGKLEEQLKKLSTYSSALSEALDISDEVDGLNSSLTKLSAVVGTVSSSIDVLTTVKKNLVETFEFGRTAITNFKTAIKSSKIQIDAATGSTLVASGANETLAASLKVVSSALVNFAAMAGLAIAAFLIMNKWDEMSDGMKVFAVTLGVVSAAFLVLGKTLDVSLWQLALIAAAIGAVAAIATTLWNIFSKENEYTKQLKAETEAIEEQTDALKDQVATYDELKSKRQDSTYAILAEADMNQILLDRIIEINGEENKTAEQQETLGKLVEQYNDATGMKIDLTQEGNALSAETIASMQQEIENVKARALAEVVAAELKEQYTQALRASNEIREAEVEMASLLNGREYDDLSYNEKKKYDALQESLEAATELRTKANEQVEQLEDLHNLALTGDQDEFLTEYNTFTGMVAESITQSAYTQEEIYGMMHDTMSEQDKDAYAQRLLDLQANGADLSGMLDENGKLIIGKNADIGSNAAEALSDGYGDTTTESQGVISAANQETIQTTKDDYQIESPSKVFKGFGKNIVEGLNEGVTGNKGTTDTALSGWGSTINGWFDGLSLPKMGVAIEYVTPSSKALQAAMDFLNIPGIPKLKINKYALGGIPGFGELFVAREAGPELVGRIGNVNAVMNNDQIVEAVSGGVYQAVTSALVGNSVSDQPLNITLKVGETDFGKIAVNSINSLSRIQGSVNLAI